MRHGGELLINDRNGWIEIGMLKVLGESLEVYELLKQIIEHLSKGKSRKSSFFSMFDIN